MVSRLASRGFTIIELLITLVILSLLVGLSTYSFSLFIKSWAGLGDQYLQSRQEAQRVDLLVQAIEGAIPWVVRDNSGDVGFYFLGRDNGFTMVTSTPIFSDTGNAVIRVFLEQDEARPDVKRLVYEEASLDGLVLLDSDQILPFSFRLIVLGGLSDSRFSYFGLISREVSGLDGPQPEATSDWSEGFDGLVSRTHPSKVALVIDDIISVFDLPERADVIRGRSERIE